MNELFDLYQKNKESGMYKIPPLFIIEDILNKRYGKERFEMKHASHSFIHFESIEDLDDFGVFSNMINTLKKYDYFIDEYDINKEDFYANIHKFLNTEVTICIYYPKVTVRNSKKESHIIYDLYIKHYLSSSGYPNKYFEMNRSSYTLDEAMVGYVFSHCNRGILDNVASIKLFNSTCLGSGPLSSYIQTLLHVRRTFDEADMMMYFQLVDEYITWESTEGVPFIRMETIKPTGLSKVEMKGTKSTYFNSIHLDIIKHYDKIILDNCKLVVVNQNSLSRYKILYDYDKIINEIIKQSGEEYLTKLNLFYSKNSFGNIEYFTENTESWNSQRVETIKSLKGTFIFKFKDEDICFKLLNTHDEIKDKIKMAYFAKEIFDIVKTFEDRINEKSEVYTFNKSDI